MSRKKTSPMVLAITRESLSDFHNIWQKYYRESKRSKMLYFPPHLTNAPVLPCETENTEIVSSNTQNNCGEHKLLSREAGHAAVRSSSFQSRPSSSPSPAGFPTAPAIHSDTMQCSLTLILVMCYVILLSERNQCSPQHSS